MPAILLRFCLFFGILVMESNCRRYFGTAYAKEGLNLMNRLLKTALLTALALPLALSPADMTGAAGAVPKLSTDKAVYEEGEDILVTAYGSGKDWVGIYARGEVPGGPASIFWYYVDGDADPGDAVNIRKQRSNSRPEYNSLPGGAYTVFLLLDDGYTVSESVDILILPRADKRLVPETENLYEGDYPEVTAFGAGSEWVGLWRSGEDFRNAAPMASFAVLPDHNGKKTALKPEDGVLTVGAYTARLFPSEGTAEDPTAEAEFTVAEAKVPEKPETGEYTAPRCAEGLAGGTVTIALSPDSAADEVILWWGRNGAPLDGMTRLLRVHAEGKREVIATLPDYLTIPEGTEEILACARNRFGDSPFLSVALPADSVPFRQGEVLFRFQVTSDWHITDDPSHDHNRHLGMMLDDVAKICPDSAGIVAVGDIADHGRQSEYKRAKEIIGSRDNVPPLHFVIGNHDVSFGDGYKRQMEIFNEFSGNDNPWFDRWIGGYHFIFIAGETTGAPLPIPKKEMNWLADALAEDASPEKPIFVFCHESILDTVAGSTAEEGWWGVSNGAELAELFSKYPQTIFFNGHSHWELASYNEMFAGDGKRTFSAFNTSAVGYLWTGYNVVPGEYLYGSEGLFVEIAEHSVMVRGRDFVNGEWTASAQYMVPGNWNAFSAAEPETEAETAEPETEASGENAAPETSPVTAGSGDAQKESKTETGCASTLHAAVLPAVLGSALAVRRKRKESPGNRSAFL